jgi:ribosomal protein L23
VDKNLTKTKIIDVVSTIFEVKIFHCNQVIYKDFKWGDVECKRGFTYAYINSSNIDLTMLNPTGHRSLPWL